MPEVKSRAPGTYATVNRQEAAAEDFPWREWPAHQPATSGYYLVKTPSSAVENIVFWWDNNNQRWRPRKESVCFLDGAWVLTGWCPIIPINKDGSITLGNYAAGNRTQAAMQTPPTEEPLENVYPRYTENYRCSKCGGRSWDKRFLPAISLLSLICNDCGWLERVRPLNWQGPALEPTPGAGTRPVLRLEVLDQSTHRYRWRVSAGPSWCEGVHVGEALRGLLEMPEVQDYLGIRFEVNDTNQSGAGE